MAASEQLALQFGDEPSSSGESPAGAAQVLSQRAAQPPSQPSPLNLLLAHPQANRELHLAGTTVRYVLRRGRRRTIGFVVGVEGLSVSAPRWVGLAEIEAALREKASWILRKLQDQVQRNQRLHAEQIVWADGASIPYLGRSLQLVLDGGRAGVPGGAVLEAEQSTLLLGLPSDAQAERIRDGVHSWWQRQARRLFEERCALYAARMGVSVRKLSLSSAQTRWGSATADGSVRLNWRLIQFPLSTIDYVVVHELAHLREMNHSAAFWSVVRSVLPGYELAQAPLKDARPLGD